MSDDIKFNPFSINSPFNKQKEQLINFEQEFQNEITSNQDIDTIFEDDYTNFQFIRQCNDDAEILKLLCEQNYDNQENKTPIILDETAIQAYSQNYIDTMDDIIAKYFPDRNLDEISDEEIEAAIFLDALYQQNNQNQEMFSRYCDTEGWGDAVYNSLKEISPD